MIYDMQVRKTRLEEDHELKKHFIQEQYNKKIMGLRETNINGKTEELKTMLEKVDQVMNEWDVMQEKTKEEMENKQNEIQECRANIKRVEV